MKFPLVIPLWEDGVWGKRIFNDREEYKTYVLSLFKEPGKYEFDETAFQFNAEARKFNQDNLYCEYPIRSKDYIRYWDDQKEKCRAGVIFKNGNKEWHLPREYYMWLNFLKINDKEKKVFAFPTVLDAQYHMALYELLAELHYKHCAILKKRQIASSYFHSAKLINQIWFEETPILKIGASLKDYINEKGTWKFLEEYRSFLNENTAWYRPMNPGKTLAWQQQIDESIGGRTHKKGLKGVLQGVTFEKDPTTGVGGAITIFFYEEAGIAPTMHITTEYLFPALRFGQLTTGLFIAAGSVGELDKCEPLQNMILYPDSNDIYAVKTNLLDDKFTEAHTGLFIPEQWSMPPFIDQYGNSLVEEALVSIQEERKQWKKELTPEKYQLRISQHPTNIKEAFDFRKESLFPQLLITSQMRRIEEKEYPYEFVDLYKDENGKIKHKTSNKVPISEFPITRAMEDKSGVIVVWEKPMENPEFGTYYASVDPVMEGRTVTSDSLCSIYVYKNPVEVSRVNHDETTVRVERDSIVAAWCGRFDDINKTHERLELIIEWYNAWTLVENNVSLFIKHMIDKRKQKYLVPRTQVVFLKDLTNTSNQFQEYGWRNVGSLFKSHLLSYLIEFLKEEIDTETKPDGTVVRTIYGIERIPDIMAMKEMQKYNDDINVDRLVSLAALVAFAKVQQANRGYRKRVEVLNANKLQNSEKLINFKGNPFRHIGGRGMIKRSPFKNIR